MAAVTWGMWGLTEEDAEIEAANELEHDQTLKRYEQDDHWRWLKVLVQQELEATIEMVVEEEFAAKRWLQNRFKSVGSSIYKEPIWSVLFREHVTECPHIFRSMVIEETLRIADLEDE